MKFLHARDYAIGWPRGIANLSLPEDLVFNRVKDLFRDFFFLSVETFRTFPLEDFLFLFRGPNV